MNDEEVQGGVGYGDEYWQQLTYREEADEEFNEVKFFGEEKKGQPFYLSSEEEEEIVVWMKACPCFFRKSDPEFYRKATKIPLMEAQVRKMDLTYEGVSRWCQTMQERHALLVWQDKSSPLWRYRRSERDQWILNHFNFIKDTDTIRRQESLDDVE